MAPDYHHIGFQGLQIASPVTWSVIEAFCVQAGIGPDTKVIDIGAGTGGVSVALAERFGCRVHAIEQAPEMARMIEDRAHEQGLSNSISVVAKHSADALADLGVADLVVAMGTTDAAGNKARTAADIFKGLEPHIAPGGQLLWGDLVWTAQPPQELVAVVARSGVYASDLGWQLAASAAGLRCVRSEISPQEVWDSFVTGIDGRVRAWLAEHPQAEGVADLEAHADLTRSVLDAARPYLGFGLYLFQKPVPAVSTA